MVVIQAKSLDLVQVAQRMAVTAVVDGDVGAQVSVHAALFGAHVGHVGQSVHHVVVVGVTQVK